MISENIDMYEKCNYNFPEFRILSERYKYLDTEDLELDKTVSDNFNYDFDAFLLKYNIYIDFDKAYQSEFKGLELYLNKHFGENMNINSLLSDIIMPLQDFLKEIENIPNNDILKNNHDISKYFKHILLKMCEEEDYNNLETILNTNVNTIKYNSKVLLIIAFGKLLDIILEKDEKCVSKLIKKLYFQIPPKLNYKCIYKHVLKLPFKLDIYKTILCIDELFSFNNDYEKYLRYKNTNCN